MCYNTKLTKKVSEIESRFKAIFEDVDLYNEQQEINAFTHPKTPIITSLNQNNIHFYQWGLIPNWAKNDSIKKQTLNARIETLNEKPSFRENVTNRCLILANGFYEWQWLDTNGNNKQKYEIGLENENLFAFAGLWSSWFDKTLNDTVHTYTIVTTKAQGIMKEIHNTKQRMPVILNSDNETEWLLNSSLDNFKKVDVKLLAKKIIKNSSNDNQLSIFG